MTSPQTLAPKLLFGVNGFLGTYFLRSAEMLGINRSKDSKGTLKTLYCDYTDMNSLINLVESVKPDAIVNCVALTSVELCEQNPSLAMRLNVDFPLLLSMIAKQKKIAFVHFSSDAVFDGVNAPYGEESHPSPRSVYGNTKLLGENAVLKEYSRALVLRVNFYGNNIAKNKSLFNYFETHLVNNQTCEGYQDIFFNPLYVKDVVRATMHLLKSKESGIYHLTGDEVLSKLDFGRRVATLLKKDALLIKPMSGAVYAHSTNRSQNLTLQNSKLRAIWNPSFDINSGILDSLSEGVKNANPNQDV